VDDELLELRHDYLRDVQEKITVIKQHASALSRKKQFKTSFPVLLFLSHQLKGSGGSLGFPEISNVAREMSRILNDYLETEEKRPTPAELGQSIEALTLKLEQSARLP
jgi:HPt (histidine-containing phosphotransfer) domain-containing protein